MATQYRQGDVLLVKVDPAGVEKTRLVPREGGRIILAYGEVTGHAHAIDAALAELFEAGDRGLYLKIDAACRLTHEEHAAIDLDKGLYRVVRQREYTGVDWRPVRD